MRHARDEREHEPRRDHHYPRQHLLHPGRDHGRRKSRIRTIRWIASFRRQFTMARRRRGCRTRARGHARRDACVGVWRAAYALADTRRSPSDARRTGRDAKASGSDGLLRSPDVPSLASRRDRGPLLRDRAARLPSRHQARGAREGRGRSLPARRRLVRVLARQARHMRGERRLPERKLPYLSVAALKPPTHRAIAAKTPRVPPDHVVDDEVRLLEHRAR